MNVLLVEPYYGGSHRSFLEGLRRHLPFRFDLLTLPPRAWKWRMRLGAPQFAEDLHRSGRRYDRILASSLLDVATFRGLAPRWVRDVPVLTYFHENQAAYPVRVDDPRDLHFALTNFTTVLASDAVAFNSAYNRRSFVEELGPYLHLARDVEFEDFADRIDRHSLILHPPADFSAIDGAPEPVREGPPVVLWAHRWEHDKDPETFFESMFRLAEEGLEFRIVVMGESFERVPKIFAKARTRLKNRILHWGYAESREEYAALLRRCDIAVSTARHEFFGMGIVEAVRAGCVPCLPDRLAYPELFPPEYRYAAERLTEHLADLLARVDQEDREHLKGLAEPYGWDALAPAYREWIENAETSGS